MAGGIEPAFASRRTCLIEQFSRCATSATLRSGEKGVFLQSKRVAPDPIGTASVPEVLELTACDRVNQLQ